MAEGKAVDRGAAFKRWVQESWDPAYRKWRQLLPPFRVRVREVGGHDEQGKPVPCWRIYLFPKPSASEVVPTLGWAPGEDGARHLKQNAQSMLATAAEALQKVCEASANVEIEERLVDESAGRNVELDRPRARWDTVQAFGKRLASLLEECFDPALAEQRELADEIEELVGLISLDLAGRLAVDPLDLEAEQRRRAEEALQEARLRKWAEDRVKAEATQPGNESDPPKRTILRADVPPEKASPSTIGDWINRRPELLIRKVGRTQLLDADILDELVKVRDEAAARLAKKKAEGAP